MMVFVLKPYKLASLYSTEGAAIPMVEGQSHVLSYSAIEPKHRDFGMSAIDLWRAGPGEVQLYGHASYGG